MMKTIVIVILFVILLFPEQSFSKKGAFDHTQNEFHIDAIAFKGDRNGKSRVDVYVLIPYDILTFEKSNSTYFAKYELSIDILDSNGNVVKNKLIEDKVVAEDYFQSRGGRGDFDYSQNRFYLGAGDYTVKISLFDTFANQTYSRSRNVSVIDYSKYPFALSGILMISSILEKKGKYSITPHITDNIAELKDGFFLFFEAYNSNGIDSVDYVYEIFNTESDTIIKSERIHKLLDSEITREYIKVDYPGDDASGIYTLQLIALKPGIGNHYKTDDILAIAQRSIKIERTLTGIVIEDMEVAIDQLRYIATGDEKDQIEDGKTKEDRVRLFKEFWYSHDPTPNTKRNEAFLDYYTRINTANEQFRSYTKGWRTDMGRVYIIFGSPNSIERYQQYGGGRVYQKWYYGNREFTFVDNTGFGDFRLYSPPSVYEKYKYGRY